MIIKTFHFSYGSNFKKAISKIVSFIYNTMVCMFILFIYSLIIATINYKLKYQINDINLNIIKIFEICLGVAISIYILIPSFLPQKVVISEKIIKVYRHCLFLNPFMIFRGFNDTILISQIKDVYRPKNKDKFLKPIPVNVIDWNNMLIIEIDNSLNTEYYIPVENSNEFIDEVNKRIEMVNSENQNIRTDEN